jgi:hypothetical protein
MRPIMLSSRSLGLFIFQIRDGAPSMQGLSRQYPVNTHWLVPVECVRLREGQWDVKTTPTHHCLAPPTHRCPREPNGSTMNGKAPTAVIDTALWASIATSKGTVCLQAMWACGFDYDPGTGTWRPRGEQR